jgi:predicted DsbA family dithiol-disulfide isomerase
VWRNLPLSFHRNAIPAANAAFEVRAERGDDAFWAFTRRLFARQRELGPELYERLAREVGADPTEVLAAVAEDRYRSSIDEDAKLAASNDITGTPAFVINGYFVSGARPRSAFERVIRRALSDAKRGVRPAPNMPASRAH